MTTAHDAADSPAPPSDPAPPASAEAPAREPVSVADQLFGAASAVSSQSDDDAAEQASGPAPKRVRPLAIALVILIAAAIAAAIAVGPTVMRVAAQRDATLAMPETVAELKRDDSDGAKEAATDLVTALRAEIDLDRSAAAVYSDPTNDPGKSIMLFGGTTLLLSPERELDAVLKLTEDAGDRIHGLQSVDPGPLGGVMKCGSTGTEASPMAVCGWADHGSIALALFPGRAPTDAAFLMRTLRSATLTR
ncbi:hypothetical protein [Allorhizocola rhizosphaerae]|uniref:hypothetical protein n=1 Tax=Allorhizocola rhizosphaerae TaxID=1872709 RepID=UPI000E3B6596|nr:hypothetical protein [Allorhizocola rhizosphaerae]